MSKNREKKPPIESSSRWVCHKCQEGSNTFENNQEMILHLKADDPEAK